MNDKKKTNEASLLSEIDLNQILAKAVNTSLKDVKLNEAFVAQEKTFKQVSEFVSQKAKESHAKLYKDYVETFNNVSSQLDTAERSETNSRHSQFRSLKLDETYNLNATWLHELYFANVFDPHSEVTMDSLSYIEIQRAFGTFEDWQRDFIACALSAGNGWVVFGYNMFLKNYVNTIISNHSQDVMLGLYPLIVVDLHEHAYYRDYLNDKKSYVIAMMRELNWGVIEERITRAKSLSQVIK